MNDSFVSGSAAQGASQPALPVRRTPLLTLSSAVAERIAAGEVIERPVSVVKELLENALDAGASEVHIEVRGGGLHLIRVTDNGIGIPAADLERLCCRHTTSKLTTFEDLEHLQTLGFRGEALASIAAVSELTVLSRARETAQSDEGEQPGYWLTWRGGRREQSGQRARSQGTTVTVADLFYNVPARLSYTRRARTENGHILQLVRRYALGYPAVRFSLVIDAHTVLYTRGSGDLPTAIAELYQLALDEMVQEITARDESGEGPEPHYLLHGYIGNRVLAQNNRHAITLFINGRWIQSTALQNAIELGYRSLLPRGKHPLLVLNLQVPAYELDVNVHPAKTEVHLLQEALILPVITRLIRAQLERSPATPSEDYAALHLPGPLLLTQRRLPVPRRHGLHDALVVPTNTLQGSELMSATAEAIAQLHPLAQLQQTVILAEAPDGALYLIDQHRAHERVIYEQLRATYSWTQDSSALADHGESVTLPEAPAHLLLEPVLIELKRYEAELLEQRLPLLRGLGIECERFGGRSFLVRSVPAGEGAEQLAADLKILVSVAAEDDTDWLDHLLIGLACHAALKRGRELSHGEQAILIKALAKVAAPAVCPHGSPILLHYSRAFLTERFDW